MKQESRAQGAPRAVLDETLKKMADAGCRTADSSPTGGATRSWEATIRNLVRPMAAAAVFLLLGYAIGRLSAPRPMDLEQLREALAPALAQTVEPALRERLAAQIRRDYQLALAATYVRVKEELTDQYRRDLQRCTVETLAVTNELLDQLVQALDTAQDQDRRRMARAMYEIEMQRVEDKTQLASGLQTLALCTEDELSRTRGAIAQWLAEVHPAGFDGLGRESKRIPNERNTP
jgi:hypothetical protein